MTVVNRVFVAGIVELKSLSETSGRPGISEGIVVPAGHRGQFAICCGGGWLCRAGEHGKGSRSWCWVWRVPLLLELRQDGYGRGRGYHIDVQA